MSKKTNEINYSLFLKKEQIKDLQSLFEIEQNNWLKQKASFIAYFNHCLALTRQQIKAGKIKLNKNQTEFMWSNLFWTVDFKHNFIVKMVKNTW